MDTDFELVEIVQISEDFLVKRKALRVVIKILPHWISVITIDCEMHRTGAEPDYYKKLDEPLTQKDIKLAKEAVKHNFEMGGMDNLTYIEICAKLMEYEQSL